MTPDKSTHDNTETNKGSNKVLSALKLFLLIGIIAAVPLYIYINHGDKIQEWGSRDSFDQIVAFLNRYKLESIFIYLGLQIVQIIISVIPGQIFQMAAGYLYGFFFGLLLSIIGAFLGSTIAYYLAVYLGHDALKLFVKPETMNKWADRLNSKKAYIVVFLLYLIPGLPKDVIAYAAGVSRMNIKGFLTMSLLGRIPAMSASILVGVFYESENYYALGIVAAISVIIFIICVIKRDSISKFLDKFNERVNN